MYMGISYEKAEFILKDVVSMTKVSATWVPKLVTMDPRLLRETMAQNNLMLLNKADPNNVIEQHVTQGEC